MYNEGRRMTEQVDVPVSEGLLLDTTEKLDRAGCYCA